MCPNKPSYFLVYWLKRRETQVIPARRVKPKFQRRGAVFKLFPQDSRTFLKAKYKADILPPEKVKVLAYGDDMAELDNLPVNIVDNVRERRQEPRDPVPSTSRGVTHEIVTRSVAAKKALETRQDSENEDNQPGPSREAPVDEDNGDETLSANEIESDFELNDIDMDQPMPMINNDAPQMDEEVDENQNDNESDASEPPVSFGEPKFQVQIVARLINLYEMQEQNTYFYYDESRES